MARVSTSVGTLTVFSHENQEWQLYKERLEQWFLANGIGVEAEKAGCKRRAILLSNCSESSYKLVRDLALPRQVGTLSYDEVVQLLDGHFKLKKCTFAGRYRFHSATQHVGESLPEWAARVRGLALHCGFVALNLDEQLRDRFVLGMAPGPGRDKLFTKALSELSLSKALEIAEGVRSARMGAQETSWQADAGTPLQVMKMDTVAQPGAARGSTAPWRRSAAAAPVASAESAHDGSGGSGCTACGYAGHQASSCRFSRYKCKKCGIQGHIKRVCKRNLNKQHYVECSQNASDDDSSAKNAETECDFEQPNICGWKPDEYHDFDWRRLKHRTPSSFLQTGPQYDHTYGKNGSGYYMYIESTGRTENDTARLMSPVYDADLAKGGCFVFWYHMFGKSMGGLIVYQKPDKVSMYQLQLLLAQKKAQNYTLFEQWGDQGNEWYSAIAMLADVGDDFQIVIEGIKGKSFMSDIAIDDVSIQHGENCTKAMVEATTPPSVLLDKTNDESGVPNSKTNDESAVTDYKTNDESGMPNSKTNNESGVQNNKTTDESGVQNNKTNEESTVTDNKTNEEPTVTDSKTNEESTGAVGLSIGVVVLIVLGVAAALGFLVLLGIYIKKCHRVKSNIAVRPQTFEVSQPFYLNLLFRKECQQEIYDREHTYEEID